MNKLTFLLSTVLLGLSASIFAQTLYVDAVNGKDVAKGTITDPLRNLENAIVLANSFTGNMPVTIKIAPGLYVLPHKLVIQSQNLADTAKYSLEARVMPDNATWRPAKMPVIQSLSDTNRGSVKFRYAVAFQVERNNVSFKGLKFLGNPNPGLGYFYAIDRKNEKLKGLEITQCYFIADKNSSPMQGAVFAQGDAINIDHCIFYGCKNAVLVFLGLKNFSLTHSIIYGAYEAAVWYGYGESSNAPFTFSNNVISNCNYFWVSEKYHEHHYIFRNSLIANNTNYMGFNGMEVEGHDLKNTPVEINIRKFGAVLLNEITAGGVPDNYLNLSPASTGNSLHAGIFKK